MVRRRNSDLQPACAAPRRELTGGECLGCRAAAVCVDPPDRRLNLLLLAPPLQCILRTGADAAITHAAHDHAAVSKAADGGGRRRGGSCRKTRSIHAPEKPKYTCAGKTEVLQSRRGETEVLLVWCTRVSPRSPFIKFREQSDYDHVFLRRGASGLDPMGYWNPLLRSETSTPNKTKCDI